MTLTNAERQAAFRNRKLKTGLVQISGFVHAHQAADVRLLMEVLGSDPDLVANLVVRHRKTNKFCSL